MRRPLLAALCIGVSSVCPVWSGCATQQDSPALQSAETTGASSPTSGSGGDSAGSAGTAAGGKASNGGNGTTVAGGGGGGSAGMMAGGGTAPTAGNEPGAAGTGGEPSSAGAGGEGGVDAGGCTGPADCDDLNPCTTDGCANRICSHTNNTTACTDDKNPCTADVCAVGVCTHPDNKTCECKVDVDCDDKNVCTDDKCTANKCGHTNNTGPCPDDGMACTTEACAVGKCVHTSDGTCPVGTPFTVDNFNSFTDWSVGKTTPDQRAITLTGINANNLEGDADLWVAEADTGSIEFALAPMTGITKFRFEIRASDINTGGMLFVGVWNGATWTDKPFSDYQPAIPMSPAAYAIIDVPTAAFGQTVANITKLRLRFAVTGGEKNWQINQILAVNN